jgi:hypothetical protein
MNNITDSYLNTLFENFQGERTKVLLDIKNDTELNHNKQNEKKLAVIESIIKNILKYRNLMIKDKQV